MSALGLTEGTLGRLDGAPTRLASTNALRIASARSVVAGLDRLIEPVGKFALAGQCAVPLTLVIGDATDMPQRQFQIDQRQRGIGPGAGIG